jgi:hypothetical protein
MSKEETQIEPEFDPAWLTPEAWDEDDDANLGQKEPDADPS